MNLESSFKQTTSEVKKMQLHLGGVKPNNGFTLAEILVVIAVFAILGGMIVVIFASTLRGSNKAQILSNIKQNGQAVLELVDKNIRSADSVVCVSNTPPGPTIVTVKTGIYTRYRFIAPTPTNNGFIQQDHPSQPPAQHVELFTRNVCTDPQENPQVLTDTNPKTGVSLESATFTRGKQAGSKDTVTVELELRPGKEAPQVVAGQIDPVSFKTTIELR